MTSLPPPTDSTASGGTSIRHAVVEGADILLTECGCARAGERIAIVCDTATRPIADLLERRARRLTTTVAVVEIPELLMHGEEPPPDAAAAMNASDLCVGLTSKSMAHTRARGAAARRGVRYLSLPDYTLALLADPSLRANYRARARIAERIAAVFTTGTTARIGTAAGTDITLDLRGRTGNCCPGYVDHPGALGSPPDIEANVSPIETSASGLIVVDGSIPYPGLGLLESPIALRIAGGRIEGRYGDPRVVAVLDRLFSSAGPRASVLAECGVGLNDRASLSGTMLMDEGAMGTMHFGFGANATVGGMNDVPFHLDCVLKAPTLEVDGRVVLEGGVLVDEGDDA